MQVPEWAGAGAATIVDADTAAITRGDRTAPGRHPRVRRERYRARAGAPAAHRPGRARFGGRARRPVHGINAASVTFGWRGRRRPCSIVRFVPTALKLARKIRSASGTVKQTTILAVYVDCRRRPVSAAGGLRLERVNRLLAMIMNIAVNPPFDYKAFAIADEVRKAFEAAPVTRLAAMKLDARSSASRSRRRSSGRRQLERRRRPAARWTRDPRGAIGSHYSVAGARRDRQALSRRRG